MPRRTWRWGVLHAPEYRSLPCIGLAGHALLLPGEKSRVALEDFVKGDGGFEPATVARVGVGQRARCLDELRAARLIGEARGDRELHQPQIEVLRLARDLRRERRLRFGEEFLLEQKLDHIEQVFRLGIRGQRAGENGARLGFLAEHEPRLGEFAPHVEPRGRERHGALENLCGVGGQRVAAQEAREFQELREMRGGIELRRQRVENGERFAAAVEQKKRAGAGEGEILPVGRCA